MAYVPSTNSGPAGFAFARAAGKKLPRDVLARGVAELGHRVDSAAGSGGLDLAGADPKGQIDLGPIRRGQVNAPVTVSFGCDALAGGGS